MFVSVVLDPGGVDTAQSLASVLSHYGFRKVQRACWESADIGVMQLSQLKREIDRVTNYYDTVRMYQYPMQGMFSITELRRKKWRRCLLKADDAENEAGANTSKENS
ncbi:CRISPR-associated protein Cas2 [Treponema sp. Marseille-Q4523]|uniref:CRISPR-associated protein Cas2 n=1 Tax=Treponema sp. Marseille-Q4523 TaxID=2810610 RepID=UPI00195F4E45|nr:CRISPR-associated protein Cas2 [Treponema sp. Marseille-Q4523]MBM7021994.1 CRISPR-associated protein Cas2 [Treponema sp. Marseille-Q4523]